MGRVVHFEIQADDPARAKQFYETVFGWHVEQWSGDELYWLVMTGKSGSNLAGKEGDGIDGAIIKRMGQAPLYDNPISAFVCVIEVDDIQKSRDSVVKHGGNIVVEVEQIPGVGSRCYCKDTEGNTFGMLQPEQASSLPVS